MDMNLMSMRRGFMVITGPMQESFSALHRRGTLINQRRRNLKFPKYRRSTHNNVVNRAKSAAFGSNMCGNYMGEKQLHPYFEK
jgi:hypothetical protein